MNFLIILTLIFSISVFLIGIFVYFKKRGKTELTFLFFSLFAGIWACSNLFYTGIIPPTLYNLSAKIAFFGASFLGATLLYFVQIFPKEKYLPRILNFFLIGSLALIGILSLFSDLVVKNIKYVDTTIIEKEYGPLYPIFGLLFLFSLILSIIFSLFKYKDLKGVPQKQSGYFLLGLFLSFILGTFTNLICPFFKIGPPNISQYGSLSLIFFIPLSAIAILKYHLFEIKVIFTEILVGIISFLLLINFLLSKSAFEYLWKGILFLCFLLVGYFLIKSVYNEIHQREKLQQAYEKLKELDRAKTLFLSIASHQLRTPLSIIKGYVSYLLGEEKDKEKKNFLKNVYDANERLIHLVNDLLDISRLEAGRLELNLEKVDLKKLLEEIKNEMQPLAQKKKLQFLLKLPQKEVFLKTDKEKLKEVIFNLVDNAIKYTKKGKVILSLKKKKEKVEIEVQDTGIGISKEELPYIFDTFQRGKQAQKFHPYGSGIGLFVVKELTSALGGKIEVESEPGKGSTFRLIF